MLTSQVSVAQWHEQSGDATIADGILDRLVQALPEHAGFADADGRCHGARAPVGGVGRLLARGHGHHAFRQAAADLGFAAGPGRGASFSNPATPSVRKRFRHRETFFGVMAMTAAISLSCWPEAANNTMRARSATRTGRIGSGLEIPTAFVAPDST